MEAALPWLTLGLKLLEASIAAAQARQVEQAETLAKQSAEAFSKGVSLLPEKLAAIARSSHADVDALYPRTDGGKAPDAP